jgi:AcrR family transcriptional regulator
MGEHRTRSVTLPWWRPEKAGGRAPLTRDEIVEAAIRVADAEGLDALSMRRLGQELGAGATSLYWHVKNKDELLDLVLDRIIGEAAADVSPSPADWREALADVARALRRVLLRHRHIALIMGERPTFGPNSLTALEWGLGLLADAGFEEREAVLAATTVVNWAAGHAVFECRDPVPPSATQDERLAYYAGLRDFIAQLPQDRFPRVAAALSAAFVVSPDEQFEYALGRLLDGIAARRSA